MTNAVPQAPRNNQICWKKLEMYCRKLAGQGNEMYIVSGPGGQGGDGNKGANSTIADGKVIVPNYTWKVILVLPNGVGDLNRVKATSRTIAVKVPNSQTVDKNWAGYRVTIDQIEELTGYDFYSELPDAIETVIEARVDDGLTR